MAARNDPDTATSMKRTLPLLATLLVIGCRLSDMQPDASIGALSDTGMPRAGAGQPEWLYAHRASADFDADGQMETAVIISDVTLGDDGNPIWEDGHRWQVYVEEPDGERTYVFRQFLPWGRLTAEVVRRESGSRTLLLVARTRERISVYEVRYSGPQRLVMLNTLDRAVEATTFGGPERE